MREIFAAIFLVFVCAYLVSTARADDRAPDLQYIVRQLTDRQTALVDQQAHFDRNTGTLQQWNALVSNLTVTQKQLEYLQSLQTRKLTEDTSLRDEFRAVARKLDDQAVIVERFHRIDLERARKAQAANQPVPSLTKAELEARNTATGLGQEYQLRKSLLFGLLADPHHPFEPESGVSAPVVAPAAAAVAPGSALRAE